MCTYVCTYVYTYIYIYIYEYIYTLYAGNLPHSMHSSAYVSAATAGDMTQGGGMARDDTGTVLPRTISSSSRSRNDNNNNDSSNNNNNNDEGSGT